MPVLEDKIVLVTGASGGLGTYVVNALLEAGATVTGVSRRIRAADFDNPRFHALPADLLTLEAAQDVVRETQKLGGLDAVIHLIGAWAGGRKTAEIDDGELDRMLTLNFRCAFHVFRATIRALAERGGGSLVAVGSRAIIDPAPQMAAYAAAKAALASLVQSIAREYKDQGIRANIVLPGTMNTPDNRKNMPDADFSRWVDPAHVAALIVHLTSDAAAGISGALIPVLAREL